MVLWKMEFLLLQQDLVDRRKVRSARRTQKKATGEVLTWRKQGRKEGAGFQVFRNRLHCRCDCRWRYRGCARKAWVLEKNFWFSLSEKTREVSTWNLFDEVAGEEFSLHLCDLRTCGHEEGRINLGEVLRKSSYVLQPCLLQTLTLILCENRNFLPNLPECLVRSACFSPFFCGAHMHMCRSNTFLLDIVRISHPQVSRTFQERPGTLLIQAFAQQQHMAGNSSQWSGVGPNFQQRGGSVIATLVWHSAGISSALMTIIWVWICSNLHWSGLPLMLLYNNSVGKEELLFISSLYLLCKLWNTS